MPLFSKKTRIWHLKGYLEFSANTQRWVEMLDATFVWKAVFTWNSLKLFSQVSCDVTYEDK